MTRAAHWIGAAVWLQLVLITGCASAPVADPIDVMLDRSRDPSKRMAAARQLGPINATTDPARTASAMHRVLWSDSQPTELRLWAMDRLIERDPDTFWHIAAKRILDTDLWPVLGPLIDRAVERDDPGFTAALVGSYARMSQVYADADRPERAAIEALNPGLTVEQAVWSVFVSDDDAVATSTCVGAWTLINRLEDAEPIRERLADASSGQAVIADLQSASWLGLLPTNKETVLWLMQLRSEPDRLFWEDARRAAERLTDQQRQGLELRHLPALGQADDTVLRRDMAQMFARVQRRLSTAQGSLRTEAGIMMSLPSESLVDHAKALCWADLLVIDRVLGALSDRSLVAELFRQADADHADTSTEYGGVLVYEAGRVVAVPFPPVLRVHDQKFYSSDALIHRMYTGLAHYHFHAQTHGGADYAGPGPGDLGFADHLRPSAVVFTFLGPKMLGVDYYQAGGLIVDLGTIKR